METVAALTSWSIGVASEGVGPEMGFMGESLAGTDREGLIGQPLAFGWRTLCLKNAGFSSFSVQLTIYYSSGFAGDKPDMSCS